MSYRVLHTNALGQLCTQYGDLRRNDSLAPEELHFTDLESAETHGREFIDHFPELMCQIWSDQELVRELKNESAMEEFRLKYCTHSRRDRIKDNLVGAVIISSFIANVILLFLLLKK